MTEVIIKDLLNLPKRQKKWNAVFLSTDF